MEDMKVTLTIFVLLTWETSRLKILLKCTNRRLVPEPSNCNASRTFFKMFSIWLTKMMTLPFKNWSKGTDSFLGINVYCWKNLGGYQVHWSWFGRVKDRDEESTKQERQCNRTKIPPPSHIPPHTQAHTKADHMWNFDQQDKQANQGAEWYTCYDTTYTYWTYCYHNLYIIQTITTTLYHSYRPKASSVISPCGFSPWTSSIYFVLFQLPVHLTKACVFLPWYTVP